MAIWILAKMTIQEASRRKFIQVGAILGFSLLVLHAIGFGLIHTQIETSPSGFRSVIQKTEFFNFLTMSGFYAVNFLTMMLIALAAANSLSGEITSGSIQTLAAKPIPRRVIYFGKWLGLALIGSAYLLLMVGGMSLSVWLQTRYLPPNLLKGFLLMELNMLLVEAVAVTASTSLSTLASGALVFGLYGISFVGSWVEQISAYMNIPSGVELGVISSLLFPGEAVWRRASYLMSTNLIRMIGGPFISNSTPSPAMTVYALLFLVAVLGLGWWSFQNRDL